LRTAFAVYSFAMYSFCARCSEVDLFDVATKVRHKLLIGSFCCTWMHLELQANHAGRIASTVSCDDDCASAGCTAPPHALALSTASAIQQWRCQSVFPCCTARTVPRHLQAVPAAVALPATAFCSVFQTSHLMSSACNLVHCVEVHAISSQQ
jgi:hypothetical protein